MPAGSPYLNNPPRPYRHALVQRAEHARRDAAHPTRSPESVARCLELARAYVQEIARLDQATLPLNDNSRSAA
jgi:hypothetical protein